MQTWLDTISATPECQRTRPSTGWIELAVHGHLNLMTMAQHEQAVVGSLAGSGADVLLDLTYVMKMSAAGLRMIHFVQSLLAGHGRELVIIATQPELLRRLDDVGLSLLVQVFPSRELAIDCLDPRLEAVA